MWTRKVFVAHYFFFSFRCGSWGKGARWRCKCLHDPPHRRPPTPSANKFPQTTKSWRRNECKCLESLQPTELDLHKVHLETKRSREARQWGQAGGLGVPPSLPPLPSLSVPLTRPPLVSGFLGEAAPLLSSTSPLSYPCASVVRSFIYFSPLMPFLLLSSLLFTTSLSYPWCPTVLILLSSLISFLLLFPLFFYFPPLISPYFCYPISYPILLHSLISLSPP